MVCMDCFSNLLKLADHLLSEQGCPWDREQTLLTLQPYVVEEVHELLEAIDSRDGPWIAEELGDVFYTLIFIAKLGEREKKFTLTEVLEGVKEKLIRRHPHVFGRETAHSSEDVVLLYEAAKQKEKTQQKRKSVLEGIPSNLPILAKAQKIVQKLKLVTNFEQEEISEEEVGKRLWAVILQAERSGIHAEGALRRFCAEKTSESDL